MARLVNGMVLRLLFLLRLEIIFTDNALFQKLSALFIQQRFGAK